MKKSRPVILVTSPAAGGMFMWLFSRFQIWLAGGRALRVMPEGLAAKKLPDFDALLLGGGADIGPERYGQDMMGTAQDSLRRLERTAIGRALKRFSVKVLRSIIRANTYGGSVDRARDAMELNILKTAVDRGLPILGTCRGLQMINVYFGGDLYQTIDPFYQDHKKYQTVLPRKAVTLAPQSRFSRIIQKASIKVNSLHNQALRRIPTRLHVAGIEDAGVVQAIESVDPRDRILGVQWHPEFLPYRREQRALFRWLVEQARIARPAQTSRSQ